jgi:hypothetical protein
VLALALPPTAAASSRGDVFPPAGIDLVQHELKIALHAVNPDGSTGKQLEVLEFKGRMLLERADPYTNADGLRQIDFVVKNWVAFAYSRTLDTLVTYSLDEGSPQRLSRIVAQNPDRDYPATFVFNVRFDALAYGERFFEDQEGTPTQPEFMEVPPSGNRRTSPTIRGFESARIELDHPELGRIRFVPLECNDSSGETIMTFDEKLGERTLRAAR